MMITGLGRADFYCYSVILLVRCCIPFFKFGEILVEGGQKRFISLNTSDSNKRTFSLGASMSCSRSSSFVRFDIPFFEFEIKFSCLVINFLIELFPSEMA